jgi:hypothetical protein
MGCELGWFITAKGQSVAKTPTAFVMPFPDSAKITKDTLTILKNPNTKKTTAQWEVFISDAKEEWEEFKARSPLGVVEEISSKDSEEVDNDSIGSTEGELFDGSYFSPDNFHWKAPIKDAPNLTLTPKEEGKARDVTKDMEELQAAVEDLTLLYASCSKTSRSDAM